MAVKILVNTYGVIGKSKPQIWNCYNVIPRGKSDIFPGRFVDGDLKLNVL